MPSVVATTGKAVVTLDAASATMTITTPDQTSETYQIDKFPDAGSTLVSAAKQEILTDLDLHEMIANLSRVSELLYLAYCGVAGTHVQATISDRRKVFLDLCADCVTAMTSFETAGRRIGNDVAEAFHWLVKGQEKRAMDRLTKSGKEAEAMAQTAQGLADRSAALGTDVQKDQHDTLELSALEQDALAKIRAERAQMEAEQSKQKSMNEQLAGSIATLNALYEDAKSREEKEEERAFITGIVSSVTSGLGSAFGAYTAAKNPLGTVAANLSRQPNREDPGQSSSGEETTEQTSGETSASTEQTSGGDLDTRAGNDAAADKGTGAKKSDGSTAAGVTAGLDDAGKTTRQMSQDAAKAGESVRQEKMRLLDQKLAQEASKREIVSQLAELSSKLASSDTEQKIHESAQVALQIAVWAFANITTTLVVTRQFWENVKKACDRLADSDINTKISDELASGDDPKARIEYYLSDMFMPSAIAYLARWAALTDLGREYKEGSIKARDTSIANINLSPSISEARALLEPLKAKVQSELANDKLASTARSDKVKAELALLGSTI